ANSDAEVIFVTAKWRRLPVHFFSHGSTMMLGEESSSATYWKKCGDEALEHGIKGIVIMGAHWDCSGDQIPMPTCLNPGKSPVAYVHPSKYVDYKLNNDLGTDDRCIKLLADAGFNVSGNDTFEWIHDVYLILIRMFPKACPPTTVISLNARYDPHYHIKVGSTVRIDGLLCFDSGTTLHRNLPPEHWALEFRQSVEDVITTTSGPQLRRAMTRLMKHPEYRDAHATDDHFMSAMFVAGAAGDFEDEGSPAVLGAETWELTNMRNSQFTIGRW
ncbi:Extradiol ring-cleavage dioxygenaseclass III enzymesubunit B, partial [Penicillium desertorum]